MPRQNVTIKMDTRALDKMSKYARKNTADCVLDEMDAIIDDMDASWSPSSPSSPGLPPAVVSGNLRNSITSRLTGSGDKVTGLIAVKAYYADFLEYGTANMQARPFIRPALSRAEKRLPNRFKRVVTP